MSTVTITVTGDNTDPSIEAVAAAIAGTTPPSSGGTSGGTSTGTGTSGGTSGGTSTGAGSGGTTTTFTESVNGTIAICPGGPDGAKSGTITDSFGDTFNCIYSQAAEYGYWQLNGNTMGNADELYYINHVVWVQNHATNWTGFWGSGSLTQAPLPSPIPNGPVLQNPAPPAPPAGSVTTTGATPVAATQTGLVTAVKAAASGVSVTLAAGVYTETTALPVAMTLVGQGIGKTTINCTGITPNQQKAIFVPSAAGDVISQMSLTGAAIDNGAGGNAAGVRDNQDGTGFTLDTVEIFGCQMGALTFASPIIIKNSHIHDNGNATAPAGTHNLYIGAGTLDLENTVVEHCTHEHEVKSRAKTTTITGCTLGPTGGHGKCLDVPDGGVLTVTGTTFILGKATSDQDLGFFDYGTESLSNGQGAISFTNCVFDSTVVGQAGLFIVGGNAPAATMTFTGCTWKGFAPQFQGITAANITGTIVQAS